MDATSGQGANVQIEVDGNANALMSELEASLAITGKIVTPVSQVEPPETDLEQFIFRQGRIQPAKGHVGHGIFPNLIELLNAGAADLTPAIARRIPLSELPAALVQPPDLSKRSTWDHWVMSELDEMEG